MQEGDQFVISKLLRLRCRIGRRPGHTSPTSATKSQILRAMLFVLMTTVLSALALPILLLGSVSWWRLLGVSIIARAQAKLVMALRSRLGYSISYLAISKPTGPRKIADAVGPHHVTTACDAAKRPGGPAQR